MVLLYGVNSGLNTPYGPNTEPGNILRYAFRCSKIMRTLFVDFLVPDRSRENAL